MKKIPKWVPLFTQFVLVFLRGFDPPMTNLNTVLFVDLKSMQRVSSPYTFHIMVARSLHYILRTKATIIKSRVLFSSRTKQKNQPNWI